MLSHYIQIQTMKGALIRTLTIAGFAALTDLGSCEHCFTLFAGAHHLSSAGRSAGCTVARSESRRGEPSALSRSNFRRSAARRERAWRGCVDPAHGSYLVGFIVAAFTVGRLTEMGFSQNRILRLISGLVGVGVIYMIGVTWLTLGFLGGDWARGWAQGIAPFILIDLAKAVVAAGIAGGVRAWLAEPQGGLM